MRTKSRQPWWSFLPDDELLQMRLKDLNVSLDGTWLQGCVKSLNRELKRRGLVQAHAWISDEWFSPDTTPGIAVPFYLVHPRLARLERKMFKEVEGGTERQCMQILRHEAGHIVQHAYALHRRRKWQETFGRSSTPYPESYRPNPNSRNFVHHLPRWYAQSHPDEDFAETFAVWLTPRINWRKKYAEWPGALAKLEYVDTLMCGNRRRASRPHAPHGGRPRRSPQQHAGRALRTEARLVRRRHRHPLRQRPPAHLLERSAPRTSPDRLVLPSRPTAWRSANPRGAFPAPTSWRSTTRSTS